MSLRAFPADRGLASRTNEANTRVDHERWSAAHESLQLPHEKWSLDRGLPSPRPNELSVTTTRKLLPSSYPTDAPRALEALDALIES